MKTHTDNLTLLRDPKGNVAFVVLPISEYESLVGKRRNEADYVPEEIVSFVFINKMSPVRAWREYLGLTQKEVADRLGLTQSAYSKIELRKTIKHATRIRLAAALGIFEEQLDF